MDEPAKVVHVMRRLVPEKWGGTESVVFHVARVLVEQGVESPVHCTAMLSVPGREQLGPVRVIRHRYCFPWIGLTEEDKESLRLKGGSPLSLSLFAGLMRERGTSLIHTHVQHRLGGMARTAARLKRVPYVVSLHGGHYTLPQQQVERLMQPFAGKREWGKVFGALFGSRRVLEDAAAILCVGQDEYHEVQQRHPHKPVFLVPNGVDAGRFAGAGGAAFRQTYGFEAADRIVLCVSRIDYQKNQPGLVRAFARFAETHPRHRLVILGPVAVRACLEEVRSEIGRLALASRVRIIEGLPHDDPLLPSAYQAAEMFVLPSVHEPFGIVLLEAWAAGVPAIASRTGGIAGIARHRENALLVEPEHEEELASAMDELAGSEKLRSQLAAGGAHEVAEQYSWEAVAAQVHAIYRQVLGAATSGDISR